MSQDLFAAFGQNEQVSETKASQTTGLSLFGNAQFDVTPQTGHQTPLTAASNNDDDDDFGDFEDASQHANQVPIPESPDSRRQASEQSYVKNSMTLRKDENRQSAGSSSNLPFKPKPQQPTAEEQIIGRHPFANHMDILFSADDDDEYNAGQDEWNDLSNDPEAAMAYSKRVIQEQLDAQSPRNLDLKPLPPIKDYPTDRTDAFRGLAQQRQPPPKDPNILFDADDLSEQEEEDDDDWGDFEGVAGPTTANIATATSDRIQANPSSTSNVDLLGLDDPPEPRSSTINGGIKPTSFVSRVKKVDKATPEAVPASASDDPWDDFDAVIAPTPSTAQVPSATSQTALPKESAVVMLPPTNVPPPSVLLPTLSALIRHPITTDGLSTHVTNAVVLAHIIAGRKMRWKRSPSLAASMRIGPAAVGGKGGMKLTGLDRTEAAKEDREVIDAISAWGEHVSKLRSAVASSNATASAERRVPIGKVPTINEVMPVRSLKASDGGFVAPHECALCGLKREERVVKVDENVEDSFGEWWVEGTDMHTSCKAWWTHNESTLRSR